MRLRNYDPEQDFARIREFLVDTFPLHGRPFNWMVDRWNFCRYFVVPVHSYHNTRYFSVPSTTEHPNRDELTFWEQTIGVWETDGGDIVGVVHSENEEPGVERVDFVVRAVIAPFRDLEKQVGVS